LFLCFERLLFPSCIVHQYLHPFLYYGDKMMASKGSLQHDRRQEIRNIVSIGITVVASASTWFFFYYRHQQQKRIRKLESRQEPTNFSSAYESLIGNTPLVKLPRLSRILQRDVYVKMESMNPGGTGKDRAAWAMLHAAEQEGTLPPPIQEHSHEINHAVTTKAPTHVPQNETEQSYETAIWQAMRASRTGGLVVEGTSGSTGISLATLCACRGHACLVVLPDDQAYEKQKILQTLQAHVLIVPNVSISNPKHYVNIARRLAQYARNQMNIPAVFVDQFENQANVQCHAHVTGREVLAQCPTLDAFVMSAGTGGTLAGIGTFLRQHRPTCRIVLVDPPGSALYNKIQYGVAYTTEQQERGLLRHRYDTLAEGIGLDRVTQNLAYGLECIDEAVRVSDQDAVDMAHWMLQNEGLWVGSSSAMNVVGAIETAWKLSPGSRVVTVICDSGSRHLTRFWNRDFILERGLRWPRDQEKELLPACLEHR
jgi:cysteine synthase A